MGAARCLVSAMLTYRQSLQHILGLANYETTVDTQAAAARFNLDSVRRLADLAGWRGGRYVHIAGTKGKGSTAAMVEAILRRAGHRTGLFTSPHLHDFRERIRLDGEMIPARDVARWTNDLRPLVEQLQAQHPGLSPVTTFDFLVAMAICYFAEQGVSVAVMEAGLGGRLDATNVITAAVSVITSISYDHTQILGDTLEKIATEKAGIIKAGGVVVVAPQAPEALEVIEARCRQVGARLILISRDYRWRQTADGLEVSSPMKTYGGLSLTLRGDYQQVNATTAIAAVEVLQQNGAAISPDAVRSGLAAVRWPGRLEVLRQRPLIIADGAHNADSAQKLAAAVRDCFHFQRLHVVLGASSDKDIAGIIAGLSAIASSFTLVRAQHPRAASIEAMETEVRRHGLPVRTARTVSEAIAGLRDGISLKDAILATGSLFVAAEAREALGFHSINRSYQLCMK
jgi:dihydrofolate synthase / folylpolyglutamate synthase